MEKDIKSSVRLPKTDFAMKANLNSLESNVLKSWAENNIYNKIIEKNQHSPQFVLHDGPPYANGHLHVGHALNKILKDIIVKSYITRNYNTPFILGWDCHGLPIEWKIEEKYKAQGLKKEDVDIQAFREECKNFALGWVDVQKEEFKQLGILADYDKSYLTTNFSAEKVIVSAVLNLLKDGIVYQGKKPVLWSVVEQTALAEAEVEYQDKTSDTAYVAFPVASSNKQNWNEASVVIWTTTPWTLPSNQAVAYGEEITYGLYEVSPKEDSAIKTKRKLIVATELAENLFAKMKADFVKLDETTGLAGFTLHHPLYGLEGYERIIPVLVGGFVETTTGTGLVHIAPSHGEDDFYLCQDNKITPLEYIQDDGTFVKSAPLFGGEHIFKVNPKVLAALAQQDTLLLHEKMTHSYPHSWRSKAPLIYRLTSQWFINMDKNNFREKALKSLDTVEFFPRTGKNRLASMVATRPDWCISRQRSWGVPLGIFLHKETNTPLIDEEVFANVINAFAEGGSSVWFEGDPRRFLTSKYNKDDYTPVMDVVDVWMDSGLSHNYVLRGEHIKFPADVYLEGTDQHRGWFQSSLIMSLLLLGVPPYKKIITHGFTLDEKAQKMSKSLGNTITPESVIKDFGADILRLWVASSDFSEDVYIGKNILTQQAEVYRKIRNTLRYLIANLTYHKEDVDYKDLADIDKWVLHNVFVLDNLYEKTFSENFAIHGFFNKLFNFMLSDLSAFYFDIKKDVLYCDSENSKDFKATLTVLNILFNFMLKWLAPFIPFTMEEAYAKRYAKDLGSLFLFDFPTAHTRWNNEDIFNKLERIKKIRKVVMGCLELKRADKTIGSSLEAAPIVYLNEEDKQLVANMDLADICITSSIAIKDLKEAPADLYGHEDVENVFVEFAKDNGEKCERCWKFYEKLSEHHLCERCESVVYAEE
ncbi:MAG: isoleucine--tRNA ligase [Alphaproteobacteria bacterium]|nr:isoleucine--tRNA ligase [Alphaproteobacteria bacterium]